MRSDDTEANKDFAQIGSGCQSIAIAAGNASAGNRLWSRACCTGRGPFDRMAIDRSEKAIVQAERNTREEINFGHLEFRQVAIEDFELEPGEEHFDLAFAIRVGALDGRHPQIGQKALRQIAKALKPGGRLYIDGGNPLREIAIANYR
ncbi:methyltransferase domain-containing protein [Muricauda sp. SK9]|uniref:methyltransferase domain-containing protein n=1 Tax=Flavobacteriaceae TaxID=49546 RepID=UPI001C71E775|nr:MULTISPECIES: methyltransferase domain-containing protein [Allomuricauda]MDC6385900.1 methyltransferase domain-containing protein [Muricauda sp. SK9]